MRRLVISISIFVLTFFIFPRYAGAKEPTSAGTPGRISPLQPRPRDDRGRTESPLIGKPAPSFTLKDLTGKNVRLSDFKGKVVILDFWATWCGPCVKEIPHFIALHEQYKGQGFTMVGISVDREGTSVVKSFVRKYQVNHPILMADDQIQKAYGNIPAIPTTFVIDSAGNIQRMYVGYRDKAVFEADIKMLLGNAKLEEKPTQAASPQRRATTFARSAAQPGETAAEGHRRHLRTLGINQQELMQDIDKAMLADKPSKLTGQSPVQVDILADPNAVRAGRKEFEGLEKTLENLESRSERVCGRCHRALTQGKALRDLDSRSERVLRNWIPSRTDNKPISSLVKAMQEQVEAEFTFIRKLAVEEGAEKAAAAIDALVLARQELFEEIAKKMQEQKRSMRLSEREEKRGRDRNRQRGLEGRGSRRQPSRRDTREQDEHMDY